MWKKKKSKNKKSDKISLNFYCEGVKPMVYSNNSSNRFHHTDFGECDHVRLDY